MTTGLEGLQLVDVQNANHSRPTISMEFLKRPPLRCMLYYIYSTEFVQLVLMIQLKLKRFSRFKIINSVYYGDLYADHFFVVGIKFENTSRPASN